MPSCSFNGSKCNQCEAISAKDAGGANNFYTARMLENKDMGRRKAKVSRKM